MPQPENTCRWQRQDKHRTFEDRRWAYVDYYDQMRATARALEDAGLAVEPLAEDWNRPLAEQLSSVRIFGADEVTDTAGAAYTVLRAWGLLLDRDLRRLGPALDRDFAGVVTDSEVSRYRDRYDALESQLLNAIRSDLKLDAPDPLADTPS